MESLARIELASSGLQPLYRKPSNRLVCWCAYLGSNQDLLDGTQVLCLRAVSALSLLFGADGRSRTGTRRVETSCPAFRPHPQFFPRPLATDAESTRIGRSPAVLDGVQGGRRVKAVRGSSARKPVPATATTESTCSNPPRRRPNRVAARADPRSSLHWWSDADLNRDLWIATPVTSQLVDHPLAGRQGFEP